MSGEAKPCSDELQIARELMAEFVVAYRAGGNDATEDELAEFLRRTDSIRAANEMAASVGRLTDFMSARSPEFAGMKSTDTAATTITALDDELTIRTRQRDYWQKERGTLKMENQRLWKLLDKASLALKQQPARPMYEAFHAELMASITKPAWEAIDAARANPPAE